MYKTTMQKQYKTKKVKDEKQTMASCHIHALQ